MEYYVLIFNGLLFTFLFKIWISKGYFHEGTVILGENEFKIPIQVFGRNKQKHVIGIAVDLRERIVFEGA